MTRGESFAFDGVGIISTIRARRTNIVKILVVRNPMRSSDSGGIKYTALAAENDITASYIMPQKLCVILKLTNENEDERSDKGTFSETR